MNQNSTYDDVFYVGVTTTSVFCRSICPAKKTNFENCEFYIKAKTQTMKSIHNSTDAFSEFMGKPSTDMHHTILKSSWLNTPIGPMLAISDDKALHLLEFADRRALEREIEQLRTKMKTSIIPEMAKPIISIKNELKLYFEGKLEKFKTPLYLGGSPFQKLVWSALMRIPYGTTRSYLEQATAIGKSAAVRAVANANGANQIAIAIPCHRVINNNGELGGYGGGLDRKKWLLNHEKQFHTKSS